ncbi:MAG: glutamate synthase (NADPH/NADH) large chain, partial [Bradymonadia bacterium]
MRTQDKSTGGPVRQGLYEPSLEHDSCGIGFIAHVKGQRSHAIVRDALAVLDRMEHRGAAGADPETGDGAGILIQLPHLFLRAEANAQRIALPPNGQWAAGMVFLPTAPAIEARCVEAIEAAVRAEGQTVLGWRDVPVCPSAAGSTAQASMPRIRQIFVGRARLAPSAFERTLFVIRKLAENTVRDAGWDTAGQFHIASLSSQTL